MAETEADSDKPGRKGKRKIVGRAKDIKKLMNLQSHVTGPDCGCKHLQCFKKVDEANRKAIISDFNLMASHDDQNLYLAGLMTSAPVQRRRIRKDPKEARLRDLNYCYG